MDINKFIKCKGVINNIYPILSEHKDQSANLDPHYFLQDLFVSSEIYKMKNKGVIVDVGSRIDGFVSKIAVFRKIEVFDIRELKINHKNIIFKKFSLNKIPKKYENYANIVTCLHTLEHIGLGRYGDEIDPNGHILALAKLVPILKKKGYLFISVPISYKDTTSFNAHRNFFPKTLPKLNKNIKLIDFHYIDDNKKLNLNINLEKHTFSKISYGCGIY